MDQPMPHREREKIFAMAHPLDPVSKGRHRCTCRGGKPSTYPHEATKEHEEALAFAASILWKNQPAETGPLAVHADFFCGTAHRRDGDNLLKTIGDGLNGLIWEDDHQILESSFRILRKADNPRTEITVWRLT